MKQNTTPKTAAARLKKTSMLRPELAIVLGSGFHHVLAELSVAKKISYSQIPGFPKPTVSGHAGELYFGHLGKTPVLVLSGRAHFYEGHPMECVTFTMRALAAFGITDLLLTNAAGGINKKFRPGDFMVVSLFTRITHSSASSSWASWAASASASASPWMSEVQRVRLSRNNCMIKVLSL